MTDQRNYGSERPGYGSIPNGETQPGDPELAALVQGTARPDDGDPSLAALVNPRQPPASSASPTFESTVAAVPVQPLAPVSTDWEPTARPRRRRSFALRFGVAFVFGFVLAFGIGAGVLYAWGQQYDGRVLPGVRVGSMELGGLTREQAEAQIENAYASLGTGQITLTGPDGQMTTISYADVRRGADTSALVDAALAAGRQGEPLAMVIGAPQAALRGVAVESDVAVAYDRDKLAAAVDTLATTIDQSFRGRLRVGRPTRDVQRLARRRTVAPSTRRRC